MNASLAARPSGYRWLVFALLALGYLLVYFHRTCPAVVALDMMKDLQAGPALMGSLASAYFYPYAFMQLPAGLLADSWGPRRTITVFFLLAGAASLVFAWTPSLGLAIAARVLVGLGVAMLFVPTMKILTRWFRLEEFSLMMGALMAVGGLGVLVAAGPLAYLSAALGWRGSFMAIAVATVVLGALIWFLVRNSPEEMGLPPVSAAPLAGPMESIGLKQGVGLVLRSRGFWPLALWFFCTSGTFFSFGGLWGGPYLMQVYGLTKPQAGNVLNMLAVGMIVGSPLLSWLSDRVLRSRKKVLMLSSATLLMLVGLLVGMPAGLSLPLLYLWCFLFSLASSAIVVIAFTATKELFPVQIAGTATGLVNLFPFLGGALMQPAVGFLLQTQEAAASASPAATYGRAFMLYLLAAGIALAASLFMHDTLGAKARQG